MNSERLESAINAAHHKLIHRDATEAERQEAAAELSRLNRMRSAGKVQAMEVAKGLRA